MSRKFKSLLNLLTLASDPLGSEGDVFFNTTEKTLKIHNGTTWINIATNTDPAPFYMHTHTYDGDVHTVDVGNKIEFKNIDGSQALETIPVIIGLDGGASTSNIENANYSNLTLLDGGTVGN